MLNNEGVLNTNINKESQNYSVLEKCPGNPRIIEGHFYSSVLEEFLGIHDKSTSLLVPSELQRGGGLQHHGVLQQHGRSRGWTVQEMEGLVILVWIFRLKIRYLYYKKILKRPLTHVIKSIYKVNTVRMTFGCVQCLRSYELTVISRTYTYRHMHTYKVIYGARFVAKYTRHFLRIWALFIALLVTAESDKQLQKKTI